tara:strand:- start:1455 stop:2054 length:600 start_codon:yes stop_codon:yes gene_type:complete
MSFDKAINAIEKKDSKALAIFVKNRDIDVTQNKCDLLILAMKSRDYQVQLAVMSGLNKSNIKEIAHIKSSFWEELIARNHLKLTRLILNSGLDVKETFSDDLKARLVAKMVQHGRVEMLTMWAEHDSDILYDYELYWFKLKCIRCSYSERDLELVQKLPFNIARIFYKQWLYRAITVTELLSKVTSESHKEGVLGFMSK